MSNTGISNAFKVCIKKVQNVEYKTRNAEKQRSLLVGLKSAGEITFKNR